MKKIFPIVAIFFSLSLQAQQVTLYDSTGSHQTQYKAYIDFGEESVIFLWDGTRAAYIEEKDGEMCVWGFNREFLGWYENGNIYNKQGYKVASQKKPGGVFSSIEPIKGIQKISPLKPITPIVRPRKPMMWKIKWSSMGLDEFLEQGQQ